MKRFQILFLRIFPYVVGTAAIMAIMIVGSNTAAEDSKVPIALSYDNPGFSVTSDQVSEYYTVANIASSISLPSTLSINENYVAVNSLYRTTGAVASTSLVPDKPTIIDVSDQNRGIISYVVKEGDSIASLAEQYGLSKDQLRWSNGKKNEDISVGDTLMIPSVAGVVYKVKSGESIDGLADEYGSSSDEIIAYNDLEGKELEADMTIILPGGIVPEKKRPEYVPPVITPAPTPTPGPIYPGSYGSRQNITEIGSYGYWSSVYNSTLWQRNPGAFGNCTWYAWYWRRNNMPENYWLPSGAIGNAGSWIYTLGGNFATGRTPQYGAVFVETTGYYGHVGVVTEVVEGDHITIQEMNFAGPNGMFNHVYQSTVAWDQAFGWSYIYAHY